MTMGGTESSGARIVLSPDEGEMVVMGGLGVRFMIVGDQSGGGRGRSSPPQDSRGTSRRSRRCSLPTTRARRTSRRSAPSWPGTGSRWTSPLSLRSWSVTASSAARLPPESREGESQDGGDQGAEDVGELVAEAGRKGADEAIHHGAEEGRAGDEERGPWGCYQTQCVAERGGERGGGYAGEGAGSGDGAVCAGGDTSQGSKEARSAAVELPDLGLRGVGEGSAQRGDERVREGVRIGEGVEQSAGGRDGAVGEGVPGAAAPSPCLGRPRALLAGVPEAGEEGAAEDEEGQYREALEAEGGVDQDSHH